MAVGSVLIHGRSDATLNRHGVRLGSADIYQVVERLPGIREALVVGIDEPGGGYWMPLFVVLEEGRTLDGELRTLITTSIRREASPRHVPDEIFEVAAIPHTRTGKKLEVPVKRILMGVEADKVASADSLLDPQSLAPFLAMARTGIAAVTRPV